MTVDDVIRQAFRDHGFTEEQIAQMENRGDKIDPQAAEAGKIQVTPDEAAVIRGYMEMLGRLPKETITGMLHALQARACRQSVVN